ncbi:MAG: DEAD/DEAH box helicase, partial [Promethearchaeota archaeon]
VQSKKYFIVIDRNRDHRKELLYNVNMYYLKSYNKSKFSFSFVSNPFFKGNVVFGTDFKNKMRPLVFNKILKEGGIEPIDPRMFKKLIMADGIQFLAFSTQSLREDINPILEMLDNLQFDPDKIKKLPICDTCLDERRFTLLEGRSPSVSHSNKLICSECALKIVLRQATSVGLLSTNKISPKLKNFFSHMILKFKNVQKVVNTLKTNFDPIKNREITLYDVEQNPQISKKYFNYDSENLEIPQEFKKVLTNSKIKTLLPIQAMSIEKGLISERKNQLIMAPTSGGKTLIGELSGVSRVLINKKKKMLYLVPIVALANIRAEEFSKKYKQLNLKVIKRVGESILDRKEDDNIEELNNSHIIVATYEAIDYLLRSGNKNKLGDIGTIIVDEIQTLIDPERGFLLDGLIARLKIIYQQAQYLYLSATIGEPALLAIKLDCELIRYSNRPVPVERHLLLASNEIQKEKFIANLVRAGFSRRSSYGFKGQSIVFTNTRKKCEAIASSLRNKGVNVRAYHSGLTNEERKIIEALFQEQKIAGVIATAALAAGVDLPAQQVIFESLAMGISWLTVAEFEQMIGRAGRLKKHELGLSYLLVQPEKIYSPKMKLTEENIAIKLLKGKIKDFELVPSEERSITELLAYICALNKSNKDEIYHYYELLINNDYDLDSFLRKLESKKLIRMKENLTFKPIRLGCAIAKSFLTVDEGLDIVDALTKHESKSIVELALELEPLKNVYLSKKMVADLTKDRSTKYLSNNLFTASTLSLLNAENIRKKKSYSREFIDMVLKWHEDIFKCNCKDKPYCECGRINFEKLLLSLRTDDGFSIDQICNYLMDEYEVLVFKGDLTDFFESLIYSLESVLEIATSVQNLKPPYKKEIAEIPNVIKKIKNLT